MIKNDVSSWFDGVKEGQKKWGPLEMEPTEMPKVAFSEESLTRTRV